MKQIKKPFAEQLVEDTEPKKMKHKDIDGEERNPCHTYFHNYVRIIGQPPKQKELKNFLIKKKKFLKEIEKIAKNLKIKTPKINFSPITSCSFGSGLDFEKKTNTISITEFELLKIDLELILEVVKLLLIPINLHSSNPFFDEQSIFGGFCPPTYY